MNVDESNTICNHFFVTYYPFLSFLFSLFSRLSAMLVSVYAPAFGSKKGNPGILGKIGHPFFS